MHLEIEPKRRLPDLSVVGLMPTSQALLAKYPKQNLWGESNVDVPSTCPMASFTTSFGVEFGLITCADLIYEFPAERLQTERGISHFVLPAAWSDEMAQMQAMAFAQGWSLRHNATLILANHRTSSESGSGVWRAGRTLAATFDLDGSQADRMTVADVGKAAASSAQLTTRSAAVARADGADGGVTRGSGGWAFAALGESTSRVCSGAVCCTAFATRGSPAGYAVAALDGVDSGGESSWAAQVCAVFPCTSPSRECLEYQRPRTGASLTGLSLHMSGAATDTEFFPESIGTGAGLEQRMLQPTEDAPAGAGTFAYDVASSNLTVTMPPTADKGIIASAALYGRRFSHDQLPYAC